MRRCFRDRNERRPEMIPLTIVMITARQEPKLGWFLDSLKPQIKGGEEVHVIVVDLLKNKREQWDQIQVIALDPKYATTSVLYVEPKPSVWQGPHRLTKEDWWDISGARNTGICLCKTPFIAFLDDRCVLMPGYLPGIRLAMKENYAVAGAYEKRFGMQVTNGRITYAGEVTGRDPRNPKGLVRNPVTTYGGGWCGANMALPLEWCLEVNGFDQTCSGLGLEDVAFGNMLTLNGHTTKFDPQMAIVEDRPRDPGENMPKRTDKGQSPRDKSHALLDKIGASKRSIHPFDIRAEREKVLRGEPWTIPTEPKTDWFDQEPLEKMYVR